MQTNRNHSAVAYHRGRTVGGAATYDRRELVRTPRQPPRRPPGDSALDRLEAIVKDSITGLTGEITRLGRHVEASEARTGKDIHDLAEEFRRESQHLNDRMERFHDAAQMGIAQVREELRLHEKAALAEVARGTAEGVTKASGVVAADIAKVKVKTTAKELFSSWPGKVLAGSTGFTALVVAIKNIPDFIRGWDAMWRFLSTMGVHK